MRNDNLRMRGDKSAQRWELGEKRITFLHQETRTFMEKSNAEERKRSREPSQVLVRTTLGAKP